MTTRLKEIFREIAERYEFEIDAMEAMDDHVHLFLVVPLKYAPARVVQIIKSISAKRMFREFPEIKKKLWGGEL
jgi:putative transposase